MNWTDPKPPTDGVSYYDHIICDTPVGILKIEWKSWKERPDYGIELDNNYIGTTYSLDEGKKFAKQYVISIYKQLKEFLDE